MTTTAPPLNLTFDQLEARGFRDLWVGDMNGDALFELRVNDHVIEVTWDEHHFSHISIDGRCTDLPADVDRLDREIRRLKRSTREQWLRYFVANPHIRDADMAWKATHDNRAPTLMSPPAYLQAHKGEPVELDHEEWANCCAASRVAYHARLGREKLAILDALDKLERDHGCSIDFGSTESGGSIDIAFMTFTRDDRKAIETAMAEIAALS